MARRASKKIVIIAGPNGAGKTTFAREFLPNEAECPVFVNADLIAAGLAPFDPARVALRAGRLMLEEIHTQVLKGGSFAFETTLRETPIYSFFSGNASVPLAVCGQDARAPGLAHASFSEQRRNRDL